MKIKENEKKQELNHYQMNEKNKNKTWNMKVMVIPIVTGALGTIPKVMVRGGLLADVSRPSRQQH